MPFDCKEGERICHDFRDDALLFGPEDPRFSWRKLFPECIREEFHVCLRKPTPAWKEQVDDLIAVLKKLETSELSKLFFKLDKDWRPHETRGIHYPRLEKQLREYWGYMW